MLCIVLLIEFVDANSRIAGVSGTSRQVRKTEFKLQVREHDNQLRQENSKEKENFSCGLYN